MSFYPKRIAALALTAMLLMPMAALAADKGQVQSAIMGVYQWKKGELEYALDALAPGESSSDWLAAAIGKCGIADNYAGYLEGLSAHVAEKYASQGGLDKNKLTEWHRTIIAVKALGGDPADFGGVNLVGDGLTAPIVSPERQGINSLIWAVLAAEECGVEMIGESSVEDIRNKIVSRQNPDGGFSLRGDSDPDVTAMVIRALWGSAELRPYASLARAALINMQLPGGGYASNGAENSESLAQVILALCAIGETPDSEVDMLLTYQNHDGGFSHLPGGPSDAMASAQAMLALTAYQKSLAATSAPAAAADAVTVTEAGPETTAEAEPTADISNVSNTPDASDASAISNTADTADTTEAAAPADQEKTLDETGTEAARSEEQAAEPETKPTAAEIAPEPAAPDEKPEEQDAGGVLAVLASVAGLALLAGAVYFLIRRKNSK